MGDIAYGFRQPHCFWISSELVPKVSYAPVDLGVSVAFATSGQDRVFVGLRGCTAVSFGKVVANSVGFDDACVGVGCLGFEPREKCGPNVEV